MGLAAGPPLDRFGNILHRLGAGLHQYCYWVREEGQSFGALSYRLISPRARMLLLTFIYFYLWLIMGAFGVQVGFSLLTIPPCRGVIILSWSASWPTNDLSLKQDIILTTVSRWRSLLWHLARYPRFRQGHLQRHTRTPVGADGKAAASPVMSCGDPGQARRSLLVVIFCYLGNTAHLGGAADQLRRFLDRAAGHRGRRAGTAHLAAHMGDFPAFTTFNVAGLAPCGPCCSSPSPAALFPAGTAWSPAPHGPPDRARDGCHAGGRWRMFLEMFFAVIAFLTATVAFGGLRLPGRRLAALRRGRFQQGTVRLYEPVGAGRATGQGLRRGVRRVSHPDGPDHHAPGHSLHARG